MYQIINSETGIIIEETLRPEWMRQQLLKDRPVFANNIEEADGVLLSDRKTMLGIAKEYKEGEPNMLNYTPLVKIVEISGEPYIMQQLAEMQAQVRAMQAQSTTTGEQVKEIYAAQAGDTVVKSELDAAYREGVNSYE